MKRLEIPPTLRIPNLNEVPKTESLVAAIKKGHEAKIIEGFVLKPNLKNDLPFKFYVEINVNNSRLWDLFKALTLRLPDEISLIFNHADGDPIYSKYQNKFTVLDKMSKYTTELTKDCFLEYGTIHHTEVFLEEVLVDCTKYIKYWGMDEACFRKTMKEFEIAEIPDFNFMG